jgi:3-oxoacyl-(acyl-carrier-protein) synthase
LTRYLEQLHACGLGTADHTTLLLNCYTKLKDVEKLDAFLHRNAGSSSSRGPSGFVGGGAAGMAVLAAAEKAVKRHGKGGKAEGGR